MSAKVIERTEFYAEIASCGIEYSPPRAYFQDVLYVIEDMQKEINDLRQSNAQLQTELDKIYK